MAGKDKKSPGEFVGDLWQKGKQLKGEYDKFKQAAGSGSSQDTSGDFTARDSVRLFNHLLSSPDELSKLAPAAGRLLADKDKGYSASCAAALRQANQSLDAYADAFRVIFQSQKDGKAWAAAMKGKGRTMPRDLSKEDVLELWATLLPGASAADRSRAIAMYMYKAHPDRAPSSQSTPSSSSTPMPSQRRGRRFANAAAELDDLGKEMPSDHEQLRASARLLCMKLPCTMQQLFLLADMLVAVAELDEQQRKLLLRLR